MMNNEKAFSFSVPLLLDIAGRLSWLLFVIAGDFSTQKSVQRLLMHAVGVHRKTSVCIQLRRNPAAAERA